uniref:hypothetical protein n=1 Tax=Aliivibrio fischeri TaxID=668 RepID=UPI00155DB665|nr:hypothetical protein [Aliivibrio fischeri]
MNIYCIHERTEIYAHRIAYFQKQLAEIDGEFNVVYVDSFPAFEFNKVNKSKFNQLHTANNSSEKSCFWKQVLSHDRELNRPCDAQIGVFTLTRALHGLLRLPIPFRYNSSSCTLLRII